MSLSSAQLGVAQLGTMQLGAPASPLVKKVWAGPFFGLYRGQRIAQGEPVEVPPQETVSRWFR